MISIASFPLFTTSISAVLICQPHTTSFGTGAHLNKPNLRRLLPKSLTAHIKPVLADQARVLAAAGDDAITHHLVSMRMRGYAAVAVV